MDEPHVVKPKPLHGLTGIITGGVILFFGLDLHFFRLIGGAATEMNRMKRVALTMIFSAMLCGCASVQRYHAVLSWPGAAPQELDELVATPLLHAEGIIVERTIAEPGKIHVFLRTPHSRAEVELLLTSHDLPSEVSLGALVPVRGSLPDKPDVSPRPKVVIDIDHAKCAAFGLSVDDVAKAIRDFQTDTPGALQEAIVQTPSGSKIPIQAVARVTVEQAPSPIVKDY